MGCSITYTPLMPKSCVKKNCVDCCWIMPIVIGLYDCIWIRRLYLDCSIAEFCTGGIILPIPLPSAKKSFAKKECTCTGL